MNETIREWIDKAAGDYRTAGRELRAEEQPNYDAVCFHAQQRVEKLMKALLIQVGEMPSKTHDLVALDQQIATKMENHPWTMEELRFLTRAAVVMRYPGESADRSEATEAFKICSRLRGRLLEALDRAG